MGRLMLSQGWLEIGRLTEWVDCEKRALAIPARLAYAVRLCLEEAVENLINYTSVTAEGLRIDIELDWQGAALVAVVAGYGPLENTKRLIARPAWSDGIAITGLLQENVFVARARAAYNDLTSPTASPKS
jgi:hypothetical protein